MRTTLRRTHLLLALFPLVGCGDYASPLTMTGLFAGAGAPSRAVVWVEITDAKGRPVDAVGVDELTVTEDGEAVDVTLRGPAEADLVRPMVLLLDAGDPPEGWFAAAQEVARGVVAQLAEGQPVMVASFADDLSVAQDFTRDHAAAIAAIEGLSPAPGASSALHPALEQVLDAWDERFDPDADAVRGVVVVLSDGGDGPVEPTVEELIEARGDRAVLGVALGRGASSTLDAVASHGVLSLRKPDDAAALVEAVNARMAEGADAPRMLGWCSAARGGEPTIEVIFERDRWGASWSGGFRADGFDDALDWGPVTPLPGAFASHDAAAGGGWMAVGGGDLSEGVSLAPILDDGRLGGWREGPALPTGDEVRLAIVGDTLYAIDGPTAWYAPIDAVGAVGAWVEMDAPGYTNALRVHEAVIVSIAQDRVYVASAAGGGAVDGWTASDPLPEPFDGIVSGGIAGGQLVVVGSTRVGGGDWRTAAWAASIGADGVLGAWAAMPAPPQDMGYWLAAHGGAGRVVVLPGDDAGHRDVYTLDPTAGSWTEAGAFGVDRRYYSAVVEGGRLYVQGGYADNDRTDEGFMSALAEDGTLALTCVP